MSNHQDLDLTHQWCFLAVITKGPHTDAMLVRPAQRISQEPWPRKAGGGQLDFLREP